MDGKLREADWIVHPVKDHAEVLDFLRRTHYARGGSLTSTLRHGLYRTDTAPLLGWLYGVAMWLPPTRVAAESVARDDWRGVLSLSRFAVDPDVPTNGASFLLGRSMRMTNRKRWPILVTYADSNQGHTGAIYRATNWTYLGPVDAGDTWRTPQGVLVGRKRGPVNLTVDDMVAMGCERQPQAIKHKFVHYARTYRGWRAEPSTTA